MKQKKPQSQKSNLHVRNRNRNRYNLEALIKVTPELLDYIQTSKAGSPSIDFSNPTAVKLLNKSILHYYYNISYWNFPEENLCPPVPGRADYIHYMADLLFAENGWNDFKKQEITCLDIGTGASCIYPIIGVVEYNWNFIASEVDDRSIKSARKIVQKNDKLKKKVSIIKQNYANQILKGVLMAEDKINLCICNPPFHVSLAEAKEAAFRKNRNLFGQKSKKNISNFSGKFNELVYRGGGEYKFIQNMIVESKIYASKCQWFSSLVSKGANLKKIYRALDKQNPSKVKTIAMSTTNKSTRIVAWTYQ